MVTILVVVFGVLFFASAWTVEPRPAAFGEPAVSPFGRMMTMRAAHTATRLEDGRVLLAGGCAGNGCSPFTASAEIIGPESGAFTDTASMAVPRASHAAALLPDGRVLVTGGWSEGAVTRSAEFFDPQAATFLPAGEMLEPRAGHQAIMLDDGRILLIGGEPGLNETVATTEIFDPATGAFTAGPTLETSRSSFDAVKLQDGRVLVVGGHGENGEILASAEIIDVEAGESGVIGSMNVPRHKHAIALLQDGRVLVSGGSDTSDYDGRYASTEIFDPADNEFRMGPDMHHARFKHRDSVITLPDGRVLIAGGHPEPEIFDPETGSFLLLEGEAPGGLSFASATLLSDGNVLLTGGYDDRIRPAIRAWRISLP
ncbi:MAG: kelch repeat-containing protein [Gammaproteobacteria bacterium]|nr:kelch repeat-containing protein [Gammaproteobacteria bacterium]